MIKLAVRQSIRSLERLSCDLQARRMLTQVLPRGSDSDASLSASRRCRLFNSPLERQQAALFSPEQRCANPLEQTIMWRQVPFKKSGTLVGIYNPISVVTLFELIVPMPVSKIPLTPNPLLNMVLFRIMVPTGSPCGDP